MSSSPLSTQYAPQQRWSLPFDYFCWWEVWSLQRALSVPVLLNVPRQIHTPFSTELASNSSCSVEPIPQVSTLSCPLVHLSFVDNQPFGGTWINWCHCKPVILEKSQIWNFSCSGWNVHPFGLHLDHVLSQGLSYLSAARHFVISVNIEGMLPVK